MSSKPANRSNAAFTILSSTLSVDEMVQAIGLTPDRTVDKGSPIKGTRGGVYRYNAVSFNSHIAHHGDPGAHIDDLLLRLSPAQEAIRGLVEQRLVEEPQSVPARLSLYVESSRSVVGLDVTHAQLTAIGELGAHFGVEVDTDCEPVDE